MLCFQLTYTLYGGFVNVLLEIDDKFYSSYAVKFSYRILELVEWIVTVIYPTFSSYNWGNSLTDTKNLGDYTARSALSWGSKLVPWLLVLTNLTTGGVGICLPSLSPMYIFSEKSNLGNPVSWLTLLTMEILIHASCASEHLKITLFSLVSLFLS